MSYVTREAKRRYNQNYYQKKKKDQKAEGERKGVMHIRASVSLIGRLNRLTLESVATGRYPWKTLSDCITTLILDGLRSRKSNEDDDPINEMLPHLEVLQHIERVRTMRREAMSVLNSAREEIAAMLGIGAKEGAINYYHVTIEAFQAMPSTEWSTWATRELEKAFPQLASQEPKGLNLDPPEKPAPTFGRRKSDAHKAKRIPLRHK